jgi:hypothetical protein
MDEETIYREWRDWQLNKPARYQEHEEKRRRAENELLDGATSQRDYARRREELKSLVAEPDIPVGEMSMSDYINMRKRGER